VTGDSRWHDVVIDERVFPMEVVLRAIYWMTGRYDVELRRSDIPDCLVVRVAAMHDLLSPDDARDVEIRLRRDLIDFRTRALIDQETRTLRELLVAKAFDDSSP
jgi:His-Xaa-Ser system protein HxsD